MRADLIKCWKIFHSEVNTGLLDGFTVAVDRRTLGHSFKIVVPRCVLEMTFFIPGGSWACNNGFSGGIRCLSILLHNLHYLPLRGSWIGSMVICCTQCCSSLILFFFQFLVYLSVRPRHDWGESKAPLSAVYSAGAQWRIASAHLAATF